MSLFKKSKEKQPRSPSLLSFSRKFGKSHDAATPKSEHGQSEASIRGSIHTENLDIATGGLRPSSRSRSSMGSSQTSTPATGASSQLKSTSTPSARHSTDANTSVSHETHGGHIPERPKPLAELVNTQVCIVISPPTDPSSDPSASLALDDASTVHSQDVTTNTKPILGQSIDSPEVDKTVLSSTQSLWSSAYKRLQENDEALAVFMEAEFNRSGIIFRTQHEFQISAKQKLDVRASEYREESFRGMVLRVKKRVEKLVGVVLWAEDFVSTAVASQPYASLAWTGVLLLLPLLSGGIEQGEAMMDGLDYITRLIPIYASYERLYLGYPKQNSSLLQRSSNEESHQSLTGENLSGVKNGLGSHIIQVYYLILRYQAHMINYLSKGLGRRLANSLLKEQDWTAWRAELNAADDGTINLSRQARFEAEREARDFQAAQLKKVETALYRILQAQIGAAEKQELQRLLKILSDGDSGNYTESKSALAGKRNENTCKWFLEDSKFKDWCEATTSSVLCLTAGPGCGKSVLTTHLIDNVLQKSPRFSTTCYYFFRERAVGSDTALCAILHQIFSKRPDLFGHAAQELISWGENLGRQYEALWKIFQAVVSDPEVGEIVCIIDALDECKEDPPRLQGSILDLLAPADFTGNADLHLKVLMTSRPYPYIVDQFLKPRYQTFCIRFDAEEQRYSDKIKEEVNELISVRVPQQLGERFPEKSDQAYIIQELRKSDDRTYLWLHLMLDELEQRQIEFDVVDDVTELLSRLPSSVEDAYCKMLNRVKRDDRRLALNILKIVVAAVEPLTIAQLSVAFAISKTPESYRSLAGLNSRVRQIATFPVDVKRLCGLLVSVHNHKVYFIHHTARQFLLNIPPADKESSIWHHFSEEEAHAVLADVCMKLVVLEEDEAPRPSQEIEPSEYDRRKKIYDIDRLGDSYREYLSSINSTFWANSDISLVDYTFLLHYSIKQWAKHYQCSGVDGLDALFRNACRLCDHNPVNKLWTCLIMSGDLGLAPYRLDTGCGFVAAAYLNLRHVIQFNMEKSYGDTLTDHHIVRAISDTIEEGHQVFELLPDHNLLCRRLSPKMLTGLCTLAAREGTVSTMSWLLRTQVSIISDQWCSIISEAAKFGRYDMLVFLLNQSPGKFVVDLYGWTILHHACDPIIVKTILEASLPAPTVITDSLSAEPQQPLYALNSLEPQHSLLDPISFINAVNNEGFTALLNVLKNIDTHTEISDIVQYLADTAALVNYENPSAAATSCAVERNEYMHRLKVTIVAAANLYPSLWNGSRGSRPFLGRYTLNVVKILVQAGAYVDPNPLQGPGLLNASEAGDLSDVHTLLSAGALVNYQNGLGYTALMKASAEGHLSIVEYLIETGAQLDLQSADGETALISAARNKHTTCLKILLDRGASLNHQDLKGNTALINACGAGDVDTVEYLLESRAQLNLEDKNGNTALLAALRGNHIDVAKSLVRSGALLNIQSLASCTAMTFASGHGHQDALKWLIEAGASVDSQNENGYTPLSVCAYYGYLNSVKRLLEAGATVDLPSNHGSTALSLAAELGHFDVLKALLEHNANLHTVDNDGDTVLHCAALGGHLDIVEYLVAAGLSLNIENKRGETPAAIAQKRRHREVAQWLREQTQNSAEKTSEVIA